MIRRTFLTSTLTSALTSTATCLARCSAGASPVSASASAPPGPQSGPERGSSTMHLGTQQGPTMPKMLQYFKRHGVDAICGYPPDPGPRGYWTVEELLKTRELCEKHGVALEMVALPLLASTHVDRTRRGAILLADDPQRERDVEDVQRMIAACGKAGIPAIKYNLTFLGVLRTGTTPGRGGSRCSTWRLADARPGPALTKAGRISDDVFWERIEYFLQRIVPACNEHKVRAACHPHDPGVPPGGFQGVSRVLGTPEGLKRFVSICPSPFHGVNFCVGTVAEMLRDPVREIFDVVRWFGRRGKIFNVHLRNIRGRRDDFQEVYPDEGDLDLLAVARTLEEVGYRGMLMPDHVPSHPDDPGSLQAFAFACGYIRGILGKRG